MTKEKILNIMEGVEKGVSSSYLGGFNKLVNLDTDSIPAALISQWKLQSQMPISVGGSYESRVITVDTDTDEIISASYNIDLELDHGQAVTFTTTDTLPAGLAVETLYYKAPGTGNQRIQVATSFKNLEDATFVDITDAGTGTHTMVPEIMGTWKQCVPLFYGSSLYSHIAVCSNNKVWVLNSRENAWMRLGGHGTGVIYGVAVWKNYIFIFHEQNIDVFGPIASNWSTGSWNNAWFSGSAGLSSAFYHPSVIMSNDKLYIGGDNDISSVEEVSGQTFDPTNGATYTFTQSALNLPAKENIYSLQQLGSKLMIGTGGTETGKIYSWDTYSPTFDEPINTSVQRVSNMISIDNILYFIDPDFGTIYATNGTFVKKLKDFPKGLAGIQQIFSSSISITDYGSIIRFQDKILFGVSGSYMPGIYSFSTTTGALKLEFNSASETTEKVDYYAMCPSSATNFYISLNDSSISGATYQNQIQTLLLANSYKPRSAYFETGFFKVGTVRNKKEYKEICISFAKELSSGIGIKMYYRENLTDSWTQIVNANGKGDIDFTTYGAVNYVNFIPVGLRFTTVQFKIELFTGENATVSPELTSINLY